MNIYIPTELVQIAIGLVVFYSAMYFYNKHQSKKMWESEKLRLEAMSPEELGAEQARNKENDDLMKGVSKYPNL